MKISLKSFVAAALLLSAAPTVLAQSKLFTQEKNVVFQTQMLAKLNEIRALHGAPPLKLNPALTAYADERANVVSQKTALTAGHEGLKPGYGENLYWGGSGDTILFGASAAATAWYAEQKDYKGELKSDPPVDRFTQMVWKSSTEVGCSRVGAQDGPWHATYIVCIFTPAGNVAGQQKENVLPANTAYVAPPKSKLKTAKR